MAATLKITGERARGPAAETVAGAERSAALARAKAERARAELSAQASRRQMMILGDYSAARRTRSRGAGSRGVQSTSADAQLDQMTLTELRGVSQRLMRNNTLVRAMVRRRVDRVVGKGPQLQCNSADTAWNDRAEAWFARWAEHHADVRGLRTFGQLLRDAYQAVLVDGDCGFIKVKSSLPDSDVEQGTGASAGEISPAVVGSLQAIEAERIRSPLNKVPWQGTAGTGQAVTISGIECDAYGRPVQYWVTDWMWAGQSTTMKPRAIAAEEFLFVVGGGSVRLNQTRGEPRLATLAELMGHLGQYISATVQTATAGACQAAVIKTANPPETQAARLGEDVVRTDGTTERRMELQPLMFTHLQPGESMEAFNPAVPTQNFEQFVRMMIRIGANDLDEPLEMALLDHSTSTAYAGRTGFITVKATIEAEREMLACRMLDRVKTWVIGMGIAAGALDFVDDWNRHTWVWPPDPTFEIDKEFDTLARMLDRNLITAEEICMRYGRDFAATIAKRSDEMKAAQAAGLSTGPSAAAAPKSDPAAKATEPAPAN